MNIQNSQDAQVQSQSFQQSPYQGIAYPQIQQYPGAVPQATGAVRQIDLIQTIHAIWSSLPQIVLAAVIGFLAVYLFSTHAVHPVFTSTTKVYLMSKEDIAEGNLTTQNLALATYLSHDYEEIIRSREVTEEVINNLGLNMSSDTLKNMMTVVVPDDTRILSISVAATDPYMAADICQEIRNVAMKRIGEVLDMKSMRVVEYANIPKYSISASPISNAKKGALAGALIAAIAAIVASMLNNTIRSADDIEKYLGLSNLGSIPYDTSVAAEEDKKRKLRRVTRRKKH